jgi:ribose/xylose/arabinose/galactoside ABC-type transport system permease subunit
MLSLLPGRDLPGTSGARVAEARRVVRAISGAELALAGFKINMQFVFVRPLYGLGLWFHAIKNLVGVGCCS